MKSLIEIFKTKKGCVYQCNDSNRFILEFAGYTMTFTARNFIDFSKLVRKIDLDSLIVDISISDIQIINPSGTDRICALTLCELIALRELMSGAKAMLDLNSILYDRLHMATA